ncbi:lipopolysaccharide biosynthesis protein [Schleiferia thermophila]|jgi:O-antigen/teichoic acid export membrane protein|uniref:lipopolysaccharide biosynthesis protein n=1 Tax=Schleiferia thermophila TaxID=884107 RepID=UPI0004E6B4D2|nr:oligosaccharide flippase family protein [Schleiferia thermophila]KFD39073.1 hypothetical protein AT05_06735 [Schleiferia thermophila str. Yellowstone]PMB25523.1 hypothetical protein CEN47_16825 [Fischerella thermalis CCMEE 5319]
MLKKLFQTTVTRALSAFLGLVILSINARYIGSEGVGEVALFNLWVSIFLMLSNLPGGSAMVYYAVRYKSSELLATAYIWAVIALVLPMAVLWIFPTLLPSPVFLLIVLFFYSTGWAHQYLLVGIEKLHLHNAASLAVNSTLIGALVYQYSVFTPKAEHYYLALSLGAGAQWLLSLVFLWPRLRLEGFDFKINVQLIKQLLINGFHIQIGNLVQQLNYRFTYFFLEKYQGTGTVGIFAAVVQLGEGIWLLAKSVSLVVYSRVSQNGSDFSAGVLTFVTARWVAVLSGLAILLLAMLPDGVYHRFLGPQYMGLGHWMLLMTPAVAILAAGMIYSHFLAGKGLFFINFLISLLAFIPIVLLGDFLTSRLGLYGAVLLNTCSYIITAVGSFLIVLRHVDSESKVYMFRFINDIKILHQQLKKGQD